MPKKSNIKYTPQRVKKVCELVSMGLPYVHAAAAVGVSPSAITMWKERYPEFLEALKEAEAAFMMHHLGVITDSEDPQVSMKLLKARFPEHYSDGEKAVNVRMQVEGRVTHEADLSLEETLDRYADAIEATTGREILCLPGSEVTEDDNREPVYSPDPDPETG